MTRAALLLPLLLASASTTSAQTLPAPVRQAPAVSAASIQHSIADWRRLRQGGNFAFADYARFLIYNPGWPGETALRRKAEEAMRPGEHPASVIAFFAHKKPTTGTGFARLADSHSATGNHVGAIQAAKDAWGSSDLSASDEMALHSRFGAYFTTADHERRADALLFDKKPREAQRFVASVSAARRPAFAARVALQTGASNAEELYRPLMATVVQDAGLMMDRARYLRDNGSERAAQQLFARSGALVHRPSDPDRFMEMMLLLAEGASENGDHEIAYNITRQIDEVLPPGTDLTAQPYGIRDKYTSLAWLGGVSAYGGLRRPAEAMAMFDRYAKGGRSAQVLTKGTYWAGRAAIAARRLAEANAYFSRAAAFPDLFYGQLALERLGRSVPRPGPTPSFAVTNAQRAEFMNRRLVQATRSMIAYGDFSEREQFIRALGESLANDADRTLAVEMAQQMGRQNVPVWVARTARLDGAGFYVEAAYPRVGGNLGRVWSLSHGVARQESSFDPAAMSHAGARGMMQLMIPTAREQAGKIGVAFNSSRLLSDPAYNMQIGSAYFQWLLNYWDGSIPLAVASYNGGMGNVRKWVDRYGDPRRPGTDILGWIERIPFPETRDYVQRVIENSVVYDSLNPSARQQGLHVSRYLGHSRPV